jgi:hypothetical protein
MGPADESYIFLSVFKWEDRKGWRELLHAFADEFGCEDRISDQSAPKSDQSAPNSDHPTPMPDDNHPKKKAAKGVLLYLRTSPVDSYGNKVGIEAAVEEELKMKCPTIRLLPRMDGLDMQMMYVTPPHRSPCHGWMGWTCR